MAPSVQEQPNDLHVAVAEGARRTVSNEVALRAVVEDGVRAAEWKKRAFGTTRQRFSDRARHHRSQTLAAEDRLPVVAMDVAQAESPIPEP